MLILFRLRHDGWRLLERGAFNLHHPSLRAKRGNPVSCAAGLPRFDRKDDSHFLHTALKEIFHRYGHVEVGRPELDLSGGKFGRAERDFRIARETKTFARDHHGFIKATVAIFVMNQRNCIMAGCQTLHRYWPCLIGNNADQTGVAPFNTIRKAG